MEVDYLIPDYIKEYVEKYFDFANYKEKKYDYYLVYRSSNVNNERYEVCFFSDTPPDDYNIPYYNIYTDSISFGNSTYKFYLQKSDKTSLFLSKANISPSTVNGKKTYGDCKAYLSESFYTNYSFSIDTSVSTSFDYQPYFIALSSILILIFFTLIFKRRR